MGICTFADLFASGTCAGVEGAAGGARLEEGASRPEVEEGDMCCCCICRPANDPPISPLERDCQPCTSLSALQARWNKRVIKLYFL